LLRAERPPDPGNCCSGWHICPAHRWTDASGAAVHDQKGEIYEVLRPDVTIAFTREKGRPMTFEWRGCATAPRAG
jgi:hypothetical protein